MSCTDTIEALSAYVDGELESSAQVELEAHISTCVLCGNRLESYRGLKHSLSQLEGRAAPSEAVFARVETHRFAAHRSQVWLRRAAIGAAAVAAMVVAFVAMQAQPDRTLVEQLVADHLKYLPEAQPGEIISDNADEVEQFFHGRVPFVPVVPSLPSSTLVGGRVCSLEGSKVELLFYETDDRKLSLYVSSKPARTKGECYAMEGHQVCIIQRADVTLMAVGKYSENELRHLLENALL